MADPKLQGGVRPGGRWRAAPVPMISLLVGLLSVAVLPPSISPLQAADDPPSTATVSGQVLAAASGQPLAGAGLELSGTDLRAISRDDGRFLFDDVPLGSYELVVEHLAYETLRDSIHVEEAGVRYQIVVRLDADVVELDPIDVQVIRPGPLDDVYQRLDTSRRLGLGNVFDREDIERSGVNQLTTLIRTIPGARMQPVSGRTGAQSLRIHARNDCAPSFYVDGIRVPLDGGSVDDVVTLGSVETLEVYRRLSQLPGEYADDQAQRCGAVAVWSQRGSNAGEPFGWRRLVALLTFASMSRIISTLFF